MLAWGVCVPQDVELGLYYMENAAHPRFAPAALEQLNRYYSRVELFQQTKSVRSIPAWSGLAGESECQYSSSRIAVTWLWQSIRLQMPTAGCTTLSRQIKGNISVLLYCEVVWKKNARQYYRSSKTSRRILSNTEQETCNDSCTHYYRSQDLESPA